MFLQFPGKYFLLRRSDTDVNTAELGFPIFSECDIHALLAMRSSCRLLFERVEAYFMQAYSIDRQLSVYFTPDVTRNVRKIQAQRGTVSVQYEHVRLKSLQVHFLYRDRSRCRSSSGNILLDLI